MRACPKCKSNDYNNKSFVLMINECGHSLCKKCVDNLFVRQSAPCPTCGRTLKKSGFWEQTFDDPLVAKEVYHRKKLQKIFNLKEDDFENLRAYNDYLERVETYVLNLTNEIDADETRREIERFQRENEEKIAKNKNRRTKDEEWIQRMLHEEEEHRQQHHHRNGGAGGAMEIDDGGKSEKKAATEQEMRALVAEFMTSDVPAEFIVNDKKRQQHLAKKEAEEKEKSQKEATKKATLITASTSRGGVGGAGQPTMADRNVPLAMGTEGEPYRYEEDRIEHAEFGAPVPRIGDLENAGYLRHIRAASVWQLAGGYHQALGCYRAIMEANCDLF